MLYAILAKDAPDSLPKRKEHRSQHLERLEKMQAAGTLLLAGPLPRVDAPSVEGGVAGSLIVAEFASLEEAKAWIAADAFAKAGVYASTEVYPFLKTLPK
jgi:uncharacterized protein YciI